MKMNKTPPLFIRKIKSFPLSVLLLAGLTFSSCVNAERPPSSLNSPEGMFAFILNYLQDQNMVYFAADDGIYGKELWVTDGTAEGTRRLTDIVPGNTSSAINEILVVNQNVFFSGGSDTAGIFLYVWDGYKARQLSSVARNPGNLTNMNGIVYFAGDDTLTLAINGVELWRSDGTPAGTYMLKDINVQGTGFPNNNSSPANLTNVNGTLYFSATDGLNGIDLWGSNGTSSGTILVNNLTLDSPPNYITGFNGSVFYNATVSAISDLWQSKYDLVTPTASSITTGGVNPSYIVNVNGTLYFSGTDNAPETELWQYNGNQVLINDIFQGTTNSSNPTNLTNVNGKLFFNATNDGSNYDLWILNANFFKLTAGNLNPTNFYNGSSLLYFQGADSLTGTELWRSDGTVNGTFMLKDINSGAQPSSPAPRGMHFNELIFCADDGAHGSELWKTDGTKKGTVMIKDINPGNISSCY